MGLSSDAYFAVLKEQLENGAASDDAGAVSVEPPPVEGAVELLRWWHATDAFWLTYCVAGTTKTGVYVWSGRWYLSGSDRWDGEAARRLAEALVAERAAHRVAREELRVTSNMLEGMSGAALERQRERDAALLCAERLERDLRVRTIDFQREQARACRLDAELAELRERFVEPFDEPSDPVFTEAANRG